MYNYILQSSIIKTIQSIISKRSYLKPIRPKGSFLSSQHFGRLNSIIIKELSRTPLNPHEKWLLNRNRICFGPVGSR